MVKPTGRFWVSDLLEDFHKKVRSKTDNIIFSWFQLHFKQLRFIYFSYALRGSYSFPPFLATWVIACCHMAVFSSTFPFNHYFIMARGWQRHMNSGAGETDSDCSQCHTWVRTMRTSRQIMGVWEGSNTHSQTYTKKDTHRLNVQGECWSPHKGTASRLVSIACTRPSRH